jgi:hypothetical protein
MGQAFAVLDLLGPLSFTKPNAVLPGVELQFSAVQEASSRACHPQ